MEHQNEVQALDRTLPLATGGVVWIGPWRVDREANQIDGPEGPVRVEPKVMQVLECLFEVPGRTVPKAEFMDRVWSDTVVTDDVLARCISELRKAFGDRPRHPEYIETIRKTGYRLIAPVSDRPPVPEPPVAETEGDGAARDAVPPPPVVVAAPKREPARSLEILAPERPPRPWYAVPAVWVIGVALVLAAVLAALSVSRPAPGPPLHTVPFTSFPGLESDPALSPDGERLAFVWDGGGSDGSADLYVKQEGVETPLRLTNDAGIEQSPTWSPDGSHIAFIRTTEEEQAIVIVPALGGAEREVASLGRREVGGLAWAPDEATLAISAKAAQGAFSLYLFSVETRVSRQLTAPPPTARGDLHPAFSPRGDAIAFVRSEAEGSERVYVIPVAGGEPRQLTTDTRAINGLAWDATGSSLIYATSQEGAAGLWRVPADGGRAEWIAAASGGSEVQRLSVAGERLTYEQRVRETNIWALRPGRRPAPLINSTRWDAHPAVAPDGSRIAFASTRSGTHEIWLSDRDGAQPVPLTDFKGPETGSPSWSPDGERLAFDSRPDGNADVFVINTDGGRPRRLTDEPSDDLAPSWSSDGRWVYFGSNRSGTWQVWKVPAQGGRAQVVTRHGGYAAQESPDGQFLYYTKPDSAGLWRMPVEGGDETLVLGALRPADWGNWAVTEQGVYFIRRRLGEAALRLFRFGVGYSVPVAALGMTPEHPGLAVAPDGEILITQVDRSEGDIVLVESFR